MITDTNILRHHRVDYRPGLGNPSRPQRKYHLLAFTLVVFGAVPFALILLNGPV